MLQAAAAAAPVDQPDEPEALADDDFEVASEAQAEAVFKRRVDEQVIFSTGQQETNPSMFAELESSLSEQALSLVESHPRYEEARSRNDPVLLKTICVVQLKHYTPGADAMSGVQATQRLYSMGQFAGEHLSNYYRRFKNEIESFAAATGGAPPEMNQ